MVDAPTLLPEGPPDQRTRLGYGMVATAATLFAVNGSVSKVVLGSGLSSLELTQIRNTCAAILFLAFLLVFARSRLRVGRRELAFLLAFGLVGVALVQWLYFVAIDRLPIGIGLLFEFTAPVLIALWARFAWHEPVRRRVWPALALVLGGLALVAQVWDGLTLDGVGVTAGCTAAFALAFYYLMGERLVGARDPASIVCLGLGFATGVWAILLPWWSFPFDRLRVDADLPGVLGVAPVWTLAAWTILLGTIAPFVLSIGALRHLPATTVGIVATFEPVAAAVVAWAWLGESLVAAQILGGVVVLTGIVLAETSR